MHSVNYLVSSNALCELFGCVFNLQGVAVSLLCRYM